MHQSGFTSTCTFTGPPKYWPGTGTCPAATPAQTLCPLTLPTGPSLTGWSCGRFASDPTYPTHIFWGRYRHVLLPSSWHQAHRLWSMVSFQLPVLSPSHSSLMPASLASSCFWGHTPFLPKWPGPRPPFTPVGDTETPLAPVSDTTGQARLSIQPCPNSLSCFLRSGTLVLAALTQTRKCHE